MKTKTRKQTNKAKAKERSGNKPMEVDKSTTKDPYSKTHLNEGLEGEWMELLGHSKWLSNLGHRHGSHVHPLVKDILFKNINTFL